MTDRLQPFADQVVPLNRWYPYGRGDASIYPTRITSDEKGALVECVIRRGAGTASSPEAMRLKPFIDGVRLALPEAMRRAESMADAARRMEYGAETQARIDADLAALVLFARSNTPLPECAMPFESRISADVVVKAGPEAEPGVDLWDYIDSVTGGCCNTMMRSVGGESFWEGTWGGDELAALAAGKMLTVCAATLRMPPQCERLLADSTREVLKRAPSVKAWNEVYRAEHAAWIAPRLATLLSVLRGGAMVENVTLVVPETAAASAYHDCKAREITVTCEYRENDGDGYLWRVAMTGHFTPDGDLESVTGRDSIRERAFTLAMFPIDRGGPRPR